VDGSSFNLLRTCKGEARGQEQSCPKDTWESLSFVIDRTVEHFKFLRCHLIKLFLCPTHNLSVIGGAHHHHEILLPRAYSNNRGTHNFLHINIFHNKSKDCSSSSRRLTSTRSKRRRLRSSGGATPTRSSSSFQVHAQVVLPGNLVPGQTLALVLVTASTKIGGNHFFIVPSAVSPFV
jgi:hypothetical protein